MTVHELQPELIDDREEIAVRASDGVEVKLLWARDTDTLSVAVSASSGDRFELVVEPDGDVLDIYNHPFVHAAWRGMSFDDSSHRAHTSEWAAA